MKNIKLYNTLTRKLEDFKSIKDGEVSIYTCGPTVYHYVHLGNLRAYVFADTLRRVLSYANYEIKYVINITDVGHMVGDGDEGVDKLEKGSLREGKTAYEVAEYYTEAFMKDLDLINIPKEKYIFPRATDNIKEQIELIKVLEEKGYTYKTSDGIYFDTSKFDKYAELAKLDVEGLKSGARVEENKEKKNITDFSLWKFSSPNEKRQMQWDSPWGIGFPGWHIECSAMSQKYLGKHFDIHTGGIDLIPVHHTNEIAQSECANGEKYVNYFMHVAFLNDKTGKMSKSNDDFLRLESLISFNYSPLAYRYFLLTTHYRAEMTFSYEGLDSATSAFNKLISWCKENKVDGGKINEEYKNKFEEAIFNDLNTPQALAVMWNLINDKDVSKEDKYKTIISFDEVLGLRLEGIQISIKWNIDDRNGMSDELKSILSNYDEVEKLCDDRKMARESSNWAESDRLRDEIAKLGFVVKDTKNGQEIEKI